ncbi:Uncharacterized protein TCM_030803 [Theobroma cacao]|uniref:Uncharacterized protein n=1 Tax=Theobroma cacao TaxID=3641 RepID=A0A061F4K0_THECC|nr:Uncharacterized protein TCM_030803 [Theobroma cacao]
MLIFSTKPNQTRFWVMGKQSFLVLKDGPELFVFLFVTSNTSCFTLLQNLSAGIQLFKHGNLLYISFSTKAKQAATIGGKNIDRNYSELIKREGKRTKLCFEINQGEPFRTVPATVPCSQWCRKELSSGLNLLYQ